MRAETPAGKITFGFSPDLNIISLGLRSRRSGGSRGMARWQALAASAAGPPQRLSLSLSSSRERIGSSCQYSVVDGEQVAGGIEAPGDFEDAFRENFVQVYRFIARRVGTDLAEDLAAEAFATAYRRRASYQPSLGSLRSWLFGIATNLLRTHWRAEQRLLDLDARLTRSSREPPGAGQFSDAADVRVTAAALAPRIAGALAALNRDQREVLLLHAWAELSHEEVAAALGIAPGTARSRLSRARAALRAQLGEFDFDVWTFKERQS